MDQVVQEVTGHEDEDIMLAQVLSPMVRLPECKLLFLLVLNLIDLELFLRRRREGGFYLLLNLCITSILITENGELWF
jgi:hypothetical protein